MSEPRVYGHEYEFKDNQAWTFETTVDAEGFAAVIESAAGLVDTARVTIGPESVTATAFDPAMVAGVHAERDCVRSTDGHLTVDLDVRTISRNWPGYYPGGDASYTLSVTHGSNGQSVELRHATEGRTELEARPPTDRNAPENWPDTDFGHTVTLDAPKVNGVLTGMAAAAHERVRVTPEGDTIRFEADDEDGAWEHDWFLEAFDARIGDPQLYSADYLRDIADGLWPTGEYTVRFGPDSPLELETNGLRFIQAPRVDP